jgi:uncharacterized membrane protein
LHGGYKVSDWLFLGGRVFGGMVAVLGLVLSGTLGRLPSAVAIHFGGAGMANGWSSRPAYTLLLLIIGIILPLAIVGLVYALTRRGPEWLNIPYKDHWRQPEHRSEGVRRVRAYIWWLAAIMALVAIATHSFILKANDSQPPRLPTTGFVMAYLVILLLIVGWIVGFYRLLRPFPPVVPRR